MEIANHLMLVIDLSEPLEPGEFIKIGGSNGNGLHITDFIGESGRHFYMLR